MKKVAVVVACALSLSACGDPKTIKEISPDILSVEESANAVLVSVKTYGNDAGARDLFSVSEKVKDIAKFQATKGKPDVAVLETVIMMPTTDKFGNKGATKGMSIRFDAGELRKVKWENITSWDLLNLAKVPHVTDPGHDMVTSYCADSSNAKYAAEFCGNALSAPLALVGDGTLSIPLANARAFLAKLGFDQKEGDPSNGKTNITGRSSVAVSQILAVDGTVAEMSVTAFANQDDRNNAAVAAQLGAFMEMAFPGAGGLRWVAAALQRGGDSMARNGRVVTLSIARQYGMIQMIVRPAAI